MFFIVIWRSNDIYVYSSSYVNQSIMVQVLYFVSLYAIRFHNEEYDDLLKSSILLVHL